MSRNEPDSHTEDVLYEVEAEYTVPEGDAQIREGRPWKRAEPQVEDEAECNLCVEGMDERAIDPVDLPRSRRPRLSYPAYENREAQYEDDPAQPRVGEERERVEGHRRGFRSFP